MSFDGDIQAAGGVQPNEGLIAATLLHCNPARVIPQVDELPSAANSLVDRLLTSVTSLKLAENVVSILVETPEADEEAVEAAEADQAAEA
ncbi:MAG: hypothetical protein ABJ360_23535, partial [Roseobacter sp.]